MKFRRQVPFGPYHADFCSHAAKLIVEIDGDDHATRLQSDAMRTLFLEREGYRVVRFANVEVMDNLDGILTAIATGVTDRQRGRP